MCSLNVVKGQAIMEKKEWLKEVEKVSFRNGVMNQIQFGLEVLPPFEIYNILVELTKSVEEIDESP